MIVFLADDGLYYVKLRIARLTINALVDTGSEFCVISQRACAMAHPDLPERLRREGTSFKMSAFNGETVDMRRMMFKTARVGPFRLRDVVVDVLQGQGTATSREEATFGRQAMRQLRFYFANDYLEISKRTGE